VKQTAVKSTRINTLVFSPSLTTHELLKEARVVRAAILGEAIASAIARARAAMRRATARYRRWRRTAETYHSLRMLDDRTLHDLGFDRSEISSAAADFAGTRDLARELVNRSRNRTES
jgi:uncharacterized protein YjiS (DUF1127 family)